jgi:hypothetical protein
VERGNEIVGQAVADHQFMEARYDEVLGEKEKLSALGQDIHADFDVDGLPTITPFRKVLGGVGGTPVISAGGYDTENCWEAVDSGVSAVIPFLFVSISKYLQKEGKRRSGRGRRKSSTNSLAVRHDCLRPLLHFQPRHRLPRQRRQAPRQVQ